MKYHLKVYRADGRLAWFADFKTREYLMQEILDYSARGFRCEVTATIQAVEKAYSPEHHASFS